jgi:hypothetical protein
MMQLWSDHLDKLRATVVRRWESAGRNPAIDTTLAEPTPVLDLA